MNTYKSFKNNNYNNTFIDIKYISLLRNKLLNFKQIDRGNSKIFNFRCPICGDSKKSKNKSRGYLFKSDKENLYLFKCYNCSVSMSFGKFLKEQDETLFYSYKRDLFLQEKVNVEFEENPVNFSSPQQEIKLDEYFTPLLKLNKDHYVWKYILSRKIPKEYYKDIYYTIDFKNSTLEISKLFPNEHSKVTFEKLYNYEERIIFPFYYYDGNLIGYQGRCLPSKEDKSRSLGIKYISIKLDKNKPKIFGLNKVKTGQKIIVVEGPIDSMHFDNSLANMDSSLYTIVDKLPEIEKDNFVFLYDQEPRNRDIVRNMNHTIEKGYNIVIFPNDRIFPEKDVNDMVIKRNFTGPLLEYLINKNTLSTKTAPQKLHARNILNRWKKN